MKKWMSLILTACLLTGCGSAPAQPDAPSETGTDPVPPTPQITYQVEMESVTWETREEDGTLLAEASFETPKLTVYRGDSEKVEEAGTVPEEQALAAAKTFNSGFEEWISRENFSELEEMAREEYAWRQENSQPFMPLAMDLACQVYETDRMVSVSGLYYSNTGGAHPNSCYLAKNFDLTTGQFFSPALLAKDGREFIGAVKEEILRQAGEPSELGTPLLEGYFEGYEEIIGDWDSYAVTFGQEGMTVTFSAYELACYAAGPQVFTLPYELLRPYLSEHALDLLGLKET